MPRQANKLTTATLIASAFLASLVLTAIPATAAVNTNGDVKPAAPPFGLPIGGTGIDLDNDNIPDYLSDQGNQVFDNLVDDRNAAGGPNGLAWNNPLVWVDYETTQNILVGERSGGTLEINGGSALRYQHLVLGGASEEGSNGQGDLALTTTDGDDYNFLIDLGNATPRGTFGALSNTGSGTVNVTGIGSVFNNAPNIIPEAFQSALNFATGTAQGTPIGTTPDTTSREDDEGFDVYVGLLGTGRLNVTAGGRVEIQDALMAGVAASANGRVTVDGAGSYLAAYGRTQFEPGSPGVNQQLGGNYSSFIGGNGSGTLIVSDGGQADFFSGLSAAAANNAIGIKIAGVDGSAVNGNPISSGEITVTGNGSLLTVGAPNPAVPLVNAASLAIGELRDFVTPALGGGGPAIASTRYDAAGDLIVSPGGITDGTPYIGTAVLRIEDGGQVFVSGDAGPTNAAGSDSVTGAMQVGFGSAVELRNGALNVDGAVVNDGTINGVGDVRATRLDTSLYSRIRGGDPDTEPTSPSAEPLRISLAGSGVATALPTPTFVNRGSVEGLVDLTVAGDIANGVVERNGIVSGGTIEAGGFITARSITTTTQSRLVGNSTTGSPLRIRLDSQDQVDINSGTPAAPAFGALQNFGLIGGAIDLITPGGLVNGANQSTAADLALAQPDSGTIAATGSFRVGTFLNHRFGLVTVGQGESLSIQASAVLGVASTGDLIVEDDIDSRPGLADGVPANAEYRIANLGKILVNGGTFEATVLEESRGPVLDGAINHDRLFRNARTVVVDGSSTTANPIGIESVGTIVSTDATLDFGQGIYNTGVVSFNGGDNTVRGVVYNAGFLRPGDDGPDMIAGTPDDVPARNGIDYDGSGEEFLRQGVIVVSGDGTTVTFTDAVNNTGMISIGPSNNVVNFLGDLDNTGGTIQIAQPQFANDAVSAFITVNGEVRINGGTLALTGFGGTIGEVPLATAPGSFALATAPGEFSLTVLAADGQLSDESLFTSLDLPETPDGVYWDVVYDTTNDEIRLELVLSGAIGADFNNDNIVDQSDLDIWTRNVGITAGASIIQGDANLDGQVTLSDYELIMQQIFSGGTPIAFSVAVPEPAAMMLLCLAGVGFAATRRS